MIPGINVPFEYLATALGASTDELKMIFTFLLSFPLAGILKNIPANRPDLKNVYIICVSLFYLVGIFDLWTGIRTLFISSCGAYLIAAYIEGPFMPWIGFVFLMGHMAVSHIYRHVMDDAAVVDVTGAQMVLVMKLTAFCWNVHDGRLPEKDLGDDFQREHALKQLPPLLDYTAWVLFFPSLFAGPAFDYVEYHRYIETTMFDIPPGTDASKIPTRSKRKIPRSLTPSLVKVVTGLSWLIGFLKISEHFYPELLLEDRFMKYGLLRRILVMHICLFTVRMKYYAVWALSEGACVLSGIGFNGLNPKSGRVDWNRLQNVNPLGIELAQNSRAYLGNWNINTNNWLRNYMYLRVTPKGKKPGFRASMATFVTSAFWHGFEPGYYLAFVMASFIQTIAQNSRRLLRPMFMDAADPSRPGKNKMYYDAFGWLVTQLTFSYVTTAFVLLKLDATLKVWGRVYYFAIIGVVISMALLNSPAKGYMAAKVKKRAAGAQKKAEGAAQDRLKTDALRQRQDSVVMDIVTGKSEESSMARAAALGLPEDPARDLDELLAEVRKEVELRRSRGQSISEGLQEVVQEKTRQLEDHREKIRVKGMS